MAKQVKQFRYYGDDKSANSKKNYPEGLTANTLKSGYAFKNYMPILQLGVQSLPGTKFYINHAERVSNPVIIGNTGIYELDVLGIAEINQLSFDATSLRAISQNPSAYLIIDIIYEDGEG